MFCILHGGSARANTLGQVSKTKTLPLPFPFKGKGGENGFFLRPLAMCVHHWLKWFFQIFNGLRAINVQSSARFALKFWTRWTICTFFGHFWTFRLRCAANFHRILKIPFTSLFYGLPTSDSTFAPCFSPRGPICRSGAIRRPPPPVFTLSRKNFSLGLHADPQQG